ncbi:MAG: SDR family oxidoreductase [Chloroflexi bacterium]|nr:SDR family oxidoreductase [Chloroflexota bacterium]
MPEPPGSRIVLVTGASRGIGLEVATQFAALGDRVVMTARSEDALEQAAASMRASGAQVWARPLDVTSAADCGALLDWMVQNLGCPDVCVLNAGIGHWATVVDTSDQQWAETFRVNVDGVFYSARAALRPMLARGQGHLIFVSSVMARRGAANMAAYAASKAAVAVFADSLALEVKQHGIKVSVLYPGSTLTTMRARQTLRPVTPEISDPALQLRTRDVADAVVWLASASAHAFPTSLVLEPPA